MRTEAAWSHLTPVPVCIYDEKTDITLCFWNGTALTKRLALIIVGEIWMNVRASLPQVEEAVTELYRAMASNAYLHDYTDFTPDEIRNVIPSFIYEIKNDDEKFFDKLCDTYSAKDAIMWFHDGND